MPADPLAIKVQGADTAGTPVPVTGYGVAGTIDVGNSMKIGGYARSSAPAAATVGNRVEATWTQYGALYVCPIGTTNPSDASLARTLVDLGGNQANMGVAPSLYDATAGAYNRQRNNNDLAPASIVATFPTTGTTSGTTLTGVVNTNYNGRGLIITAIYSGASGGCLCAATIYGIDQAGNQYTLLAQTASGNGTYFLTVYPGCIASAGLVANYPLPRRFRVDFTASVGGSINITGTGCIIL